MKTKFKLMGLAMLLTLSAFSTSCEDKSVKPSVIVIESYCDFIRINGDYTQGGKVEGDLYLGVKETLNSSKLYQIRVGCMANKCAYSFNGVTYNQSKTFLKGVDYGN